MTFEEACGLVREWPQSMELDSTAEYTGGNATHRDGWASPVRVVLHAEDWVVICEDSDAHGVENSLPAACRLRGEALGFCSAEELGALMAHGSPRLRELAILELGRRENSAVSFG